MKTKHLMTSMFALMAVLMTSCADKETVAGVNADGTKTVTFNVTTDAQAQTRTAPTVSGYKLNYIMQVVDASGNAVAETTQNNQTGSFTVKLPVGVTYTCLFWADFISNSSSSAADNEYFTTTDLKAVALKQALTGDDQCQAFCGTASVAADQAAATTNVTLKRAVAQVNLRGMEAMQGYSKLEATYTNVPNTFNVLNNTTSVSGTTGIAPDFTVTDFSGATDGNNFTFQSAYFLAPGTEAANMVQIELKTYNSTAPSTPIETLTIANVPTKKNYKTNVTGKFKPANVEHTYTIDFGEWGTDIAHKMPSVWNGTYPSVSVNAAFSGGTGTQSDPYIIGSAADLAQLAVNVNAGTDYDSNYFELTIDIDLNNKPWTPIGKDFDNTLIGVFDGNGHKITNLNINSNLQRVGLFGYYKGGIKNLHVSGNVTSTSAISAADDYYYGAMAATGGIVAFYADASSDSLSNCSFEGTVTAANGCAGGIAGITSSVTITNCKNSGTISGGIRTGGIAGSINEGAYIYHSYNIGTVHGKEITGGICGRMYQGEVGHCYNTGDISSDNDSQAGAIYGAESYGTITDCYAKTKLTVTASGETQFGSSAWPTWTADTAADGTDAKGYWKSLGNWNSGTNPEYPKLWWEE